MSVDQHLKLELQISSSQALVRRIDQRIDLVERLLAEADMAQAMVIPTSFTNSIGIKMMWCPPGEFVMGSPADETGRWEEDGRENQIEARVKHGFWIACTPVTQEQWHAVKGSNPSFFKGSDQLPVECVSWEDAQEFCTKLNAIEPVRPGFSYRLPTEMQWEYACRAGTTGPYHGSRLDDVGWYKENSGGRTHEVGLKQANAWGLRDMHGNVSEWCADWHEEPHPNSTNFMKALKWSGYLLRGGSFISSAGSCRSAVRFWARLHHGSQYDGFRVALVPLEQ